MAVTKLMHIKEARPGGSVSLKRSISYIMNPEKTGDGLLTGSNAGTDPSEIFQVMMETKQEWGKTGGRQGYHFVISWRPGEVTRDQAYRITGTFCERYLGDAYDYVYAVHTDQEHLHAHIVFNSVNRMDGYKYRYEKGDWEKYIQPVTDEICQEEGLEKLTVGKDKSRSRSYAEHKADKEGLPTLTKIVRADIDRMIARSQSFDDFLSNMRRLGYQIRIGKYITYTPPGFTKGRRDKKLGEGYSMDEIIFRINHKGQEEPRMTRVISTGADQRLREALKPYLSQKLPAIQIIYVKKIYRVGNYLDARNPFAVSWRNVRKDAMEIAKLFEECMYLIDHDISDMDVLQSRLSDAGRKEKNLIRRILDRDADASWQEKEYGRQPSRGSEVKGEGMESMLHTKSGDTYREKKEEPDASYR